MGVQAPPSKTAHGGQIGFASPPGGRDALQLFMIGCIRRVHQRHLYDVETGAPGHHPPFARASGIACSSQALPREDQDISEGILDILHAEGVRV